LEGLVFEEALTPSELDGWIQHAAGDSARSHYIAYLLAKGRLAQAIAWIEQGHATLKDLVPLLEDPEAKMNLRLGVGAILEHFEGAQAIRIMIPDLVALLQNSHAAIRTDICHYLSLTHSREVIPVLEKMLEDEEQEVRQTAKESIEVLNQT
jgi:HEAT repeat protein